MAAAAIVAVPIAGALGTRPSGWPERLRPRLATIPAKTVVLNDVSAGGWLLWADPHLTPVIDTRSEVYSTEYVRDYQRTQDVRAGWQWLLDRTKPGYALLKANAPLTVALRDQLSWTTVGKDADYVLLMAP